jgi:hypothetical protein
MSGQQNLSLNGSSLPEQIVSAIAIRENALRKEQNILINLVGKTPGEIRAKLEGLSQADRKKLVSTLAALQMKSQRLLDGSRGSGLAVPKVWKILESITSIEERSADISFVQKTAAADPLSAVLGDATRSAKLLVVDGHQVCELDGKSSLTEQDIKNVWVITTSTGRKIYLFKELPSVVTAHKSNILLGGFSLDNKGALEQAIDSNAVAKFPGERGEVKISLPTLRNQRELEGHNDHVYAIANEWGRTITPKQIKFGTAFREVAVQDLSNGRPLRVSYALHEVGVYTGLPEAGRGISDGTFFVPLVKPKPSQFESAFRYLTNFRELSEGQWPILLKALELKFPRELIGKGLAEAEKSDIEKILGTTNKEPSKRSNRTGCFHGYDGQEVRIPNSTTSTSYLLFIIPRPGDTPVFVVDTPEMGAAYIFTNKDFAMALATGELSPSEIVRQKLHVARIVHAGEVHEWMASFDTELIKLGVPPRKQ